MVAIDLCCFSPHKQGSVLLLPVWTLTLSEVKRSDSDLNVEFF